MSRVYNFSAGPSMLPESVFKKPREKCWNTRAPDNPSWKCHTAQKRMRQLSMDVRHFYVK